jgi:hypothetical protein
VPIIIILFIHSFIDCSIFLLCLLNDKLFFCFLGICGFSLSVVDTPKGDLDSSDSIDGPDMTLLYNSVNYPYGTSEQFPDTLNSDLHRIDQTAHVYAECSNAGVCNRKTGDCECFEGFEGAFCNRMRCPGDPLECNGNGICQSLQKTGKSENKDTLYNLWDKNLIRGCICDKGFYGSDCSMRYCKEGLDPEYLDDVATINVPSFFLTILTTANNYDINDGFAQPNPGYFRLRIYDQHDAPYITGPIQAGSTCKQIVDALERLPHRVIPFGKTICIHNSFNGQNPLATTSPWKVRYQSLYNLYANGAKLYELSSIPAIDDFGYTVSYMNQSKHSTDELLSGDLYYFQFYGNIGYFRQPEINTVLYDTNSNKPSLVSKTGKIVARTWTNGQQGYSIDYFTHHCMNIQIKLKNSEGQTFIWGSNFNLLRFAACLGDSDEIDANNIYLSPTATPHESWEYGTLLNPHLIRLVRQVKDPYDGGFLAAIIYDPNSNFDQLRGTRNSYAILGAFRFLHPIHSLDVFNPEGVIYEAYTTKGILKVTNTDAEAVFNFGSNQIYTLNTKFDFHGIASGGNVTYDGDISCENLEATTTTAAVPGGGGGVIDSRLQCIDKNDLFIILDPHTTNNNPAYLNLYTAVSIQRFLDVQLSSIEEEYQNWNITIASKFNNITSRYRKNLIKSDLNVNWAQNAKADGKFYIYKFTPHVETTYHFINECSNRGLCNTFEGICECFHSYTGEDCSKQDYVMV